MNSIRKFQKRKLQEEGKWQRGGFRAHPQELEIRRFSTNNRKRTPGVMAAIYTNIETVTVGGWLRRLSKILR